MTPEERDMAWQEEALCAQTDPELFFPNKGVSGEPAKRVCRRCDVRAQCLAYALQFDDQGVWGGLSRVERNKVKAARRPQGQVAA